MDRPATVSASDAPAQRARLGGTTHPGDTSVWDDPSTGSSVATATVDAPTLPTEVQPPASEVDAAAAAPAPVEQAPVPSLPPIARDDPTPPTAAAPRNETKVLPDANQGPGSSIFDVTVPGVAATPAPTTPARSEPALAPQAVADRTKPPTVAARVPKVARRRRPLTARHLLIAVAALAVVVAAGWWWSNRSSSPAEPLTDAAAATGTADGASDAANGAASPDSSGPEAAVDNSPAVEPAPRDDGAAAIGEPTPAIDPVDHGAIATEAVTEPATDTDPGATDIATEPAATATVIDLTDPESADSGSSETDPGEPVTAPVVDPPAEAAADGRTVELTTRNEPCRFGNDCLIVGFELVGFDGHPGSFTCEFASGSRFEFSFSKTSVTTACMTGSAGDSITIEVDGVRSATAVHQ